MYGRLSPGPQCRSEGTLLVSFTFMWVPGIKFSHHSYQQGRLATLLYPFEACVGYVMPKLR